MTTDELRHLLEMAAKACGIEIEQCTCTDVPFRRKDNRQHWTPDTDDGDSARLRTALEISVNWFDDVVECSNDDTLVIELYADHSGDKDAALRLATLKLAAEIGRRMP